MQVTSVDVRLLVTVTCPPGTANSRELAIDLACETVGIDLAARSNAWEYCDCRRGNRSYIVTFTR